jgi:hypothetical protein
LKENAPPVAAAPPVVAVPPVAPPMVAAPPVVAPMPSSSSGPEPLPPPPPTHAALDGRLPPDGKTLPPLPDRSPSTGTLLGIGDSERRSTKPLPLTDLAAEIPSSSAEASLPGVKDDGPTTPTPRVDPADFDEPPAPAPPPPTRAPTPPTRAPTPPRSLPALFSKSVEEEPRERGPRDDSLTLPKPRKATVTKLETATRPAERKPGQTGKSPAFVEPPAPGPTPLPPPIAPLPDPALMPPFTNESSIEYRSSESGLRPFPSLEGPSPTPMMPTLALPPMPAGPISSGILGSVKYLLPLARAMIARKRAQRSIRQLLVGDQHLLDQVLRDLGRAAREHSLDVPAVADEMRRVKAEEQRRAKAEADIAKAGDDLGREDARWNGDEAERKSEIGRREGELKESEDELRQRGDERRGHEAERARLDGLIRAAEKQSSQALQQAQKAEITPPEKGGGPNTAANLRAQADESQREATALIAPRDEARTKAEALDAPIHALTQKIVEQRAELARLRKELADAAAQHKKTSAGIEADRARAEHERSEAQREMSQRFVNVGTMLNLHRVDDDHYRSLYARIDELKSGLNAREATIVRLESELRTYDRGAVQTGLITVGVILAALVILSIILAVVFSR